MKLPRPHETQEELCTNKTLVAGKSGSPHEQGEIPAVLCKIYAQAGNVYRFEAPSRGMMQCQPRDWSIKFLGTRLAYVI